MAVALSSALIAGPLKDTETIDRLHKIALALARKVAQQQPEAVDALAVAVTNRACSLLLQSYGWESEREAAADLRRLAELARQHCLLQNCQELQDTVAASLRGLCKRASSEHGAWTEEDCSDDDVDDLWGPGRLQRWANHAHLLLEAGRQQLLSARGVREVQRALEEELQRCLTGVSCKDLKRWAAVLMSGSHYLSQAAGTTAASTLQEAVAKTEDAACDSDQTSFALALAQVKGARRERQKHAWQRQKGETVSAATLPEMEKMPESISGIIFQALHDCISTSEEILTTRQVLEQVGFREPAPGWRAAHKHVDSALDSMRQTGRTAATSVPLSPTAPETWVTVAAAPTQSPETPTLLNHKEAFRPARHSPTQQRGCLSAGSWRKVRSPPTPAAGDATVRSVPRASSAMRLERTPEVMTPLQRGQVRVQALRAEIRKPRSFVT
eukprot:TRINITY_DN33526_c0_g1_i2.p1 TRINITY_DN33526_c0_g1~~TRINITY_DN33526_c0_g1_i2.p1  ORF type:complete len:442 (-),score=83.96 TRINITY_DN33526_c0_g1_i2:116-1441(-)